MNLSPVATKSIMQMHFVHMNHSKRCNTLETLDAMTIINRVVAYPYYPPPHPSLFLIRIPNIGLMLVCRAFAFDT